MIGVLVSLGLLLPSLVWAQWSRDHDLVGGRGTLQRVGTAHQLTLQVTDPHFGVLRNEIYRRGVASIGGTYTYDFAQFVPSDFATSPLFLETAQFLPQDQWNSGGPHAWFGPVMHIGIQRGRWEFHTSQMVNGREVSRTVDLGPVQRNRWIPWRIAVKWSPNSDGWVTVQKDGRTVFQRQGATTFTSQEVPYFKTGLYTRRGWSQGGGPSPLDTFRILVSDLTVRQGASGGAPPSSPASPPTAPGPARPTPDAPIPVTPPAPRPKTPEEVLRDADVDPSTIDVPQAPTATPVDIPDTPPMPKLPPRPVLPPVAVRPPQTPPAYSGGGSGST